MPAGSVGVAIRREFGIGQPAVSNQLRLLREREIVEVRAEGSRRMYQLRAGALADVTAWVERYSRLWPQRLDALDTELRRGRRADDSSSARRPYPAEASQATQES